MFRAVFYGLGWWLAASVPALAGAWLQAEGHSFAAASSTTRTDAYGIETEGEASIYFEHGMRRDMTIGVDLNSGADGYGHAFAFLRRPLGNADTPVVLAYDLGGGARRQTGDWEPVVKLGLSLGRGFARPKGNGWLALDSSVEIGAATGDVSGKIDATLGLPLLARLQTVLQIETTHWPDTPSVIAVTPSLLWEVRTGTFLKLGVEARSARSDTLGLRFAYWRKF